MPPSQRRYCLTLATAIIMSTNILSGLFTVASAQSTSSSSATSSSNTASSTPKVISIDVGPAGSHGYSPNNVTANIGDIVQFLFFPTNHSVVRGEYYASGACGNGDCNPCVPYELIHPDASNKGFHSDNFLTQILPTNGKGSSYNITITDLDPIWFYCTALESCTPNGMVGVINPPKNTSIDAQIAAAKKAKFQLTPGQTWPAEGGAPGAASPSASSSSTPQPSDGHAWPGVTHDHHLSGGAIAGIAVGAAAVLVLAGALFYFVGRSQTYKNIIKERNSEGHVPSQIGESTFSPGTQTPSMGQGPWGQPDHRFSGQTAYGGQPGSFIGYNRQTGAPEFANEAPSALEKVGPPGSPPSGHPAFNGSQGTTYELPGNHPAVAEVGPYK